MSFRTLPIGAVALPFLLALACSTPPPRPAHVPESEPDAATSDAGEASPGEDAQPSAAPAGATVAERCKAVCNRILAVSVEGARPEAHAGWLGDCRKACERHATVGQLECYERTRLARDLEACMVE